MMNRRQTMIEGRDLVIRSLVSSSIREFPCILLCSGTKYQSQAIEIYRKLSSGTTPQFIADIIANSYVRMTTLSGNKRTCTFGSSIVTTPSVRDNKGNIQFIPTTTLSRIKAGACISISSETALDKILTTSSLRHYYWSDDSHHFVCKISNTSTFVTDYESSAKPIGDRFRLLTLSSMYTPEIFDADHINIELVGRRQSLQIDKSTERGKYLFKDMPTEVQSVTISKKERSRGLQNTPGAYDSPALQVSDIQCEVYGENFEHTPQLSVQGFLSQSTDIRDDSLNIWIEWSNVPHFIPAGTVLKYSYSVKPSEIRVCS